ncbi:unnamed protein product [Cylicocyclus nassatus]|uniref:Uncharacterized protein n=1 Tax=Cylicocyclus nassatus TaxID=53992 RepID=A0AA36GTD6_CYLNA|nr:unnamed protein product [Cylicocyclus nassatus]
MWEEIRFSEWYTYRFVLPEVEFSDFAYSEIKGSRVAECVSNVRSRCKLRIWQSPIPMGSIWKQTIATSN